MGSLPIIIKVTSVVLYNIVDGLDFVFATFAGCSILAGLFSKAISTKIVFSILSAPSIMFVFKDSLIECVQSILDNILNHISSKLIGG